MTDSITVAGVVGTDPQHHITAQGLEITSFRLASTRRYFDRAKASWEDGETNWYTVSTFRQLAANVHASIRKGERVLVRGRLRLRQWESGERTGTTAEIESESLGHDLTWGVSTFERVRVSRPVDGHEQQSPEAASEHLADRDSALGWPVSEPPPVPLGFGSSVLSDGSDRSDSPVFVVADTGAEERGRAVSARG
ncbi:MAG: hypothetical protein B5766_07595 [Candidatus Lumbricidophila eiseniae]|uniref:Single-stranded DNA-binding protein n=1 Tax=Candidatus Lumbricidiphila eiseniae TaxID=1969409 RepID=A0A2A6FRX2_9MICO|nr:MAG: hypothetical protein B5766_07595 [Candidatus Lumbricidophila eiseniae]